MKRITMLLATTTIAILVFAPAAIAQTFGPGPQPGGTGGIYQPYYYPYSGETPGSGTAPAPAGSDATDSQQYVYPDTTPASSSETTPTDTAGEEQ